MADNKINNLPPVDWYATHEFGREVPPGCEPAGPGAISAWVAGVPAPQGSKRAFGAGRPGGKIRMVESSTRVKPWREDVRQAFREKLEGLTSATGGAASMAAQAFPEGPVVVKIVFVMPRTKAMRNRPSADFPMVQKPDTDKLARAVLDALTSAGVYADDGQVVALHAFKRRAEPGEPTGAMIHIEPYRPRSQHCTGCRTGNGDHVFGCELSTPGRNGQPDVEVFDLVGWCRDHGVTVINGASLPSDTLESVEATMQGVGAFLDAAKRYGFVQ